jgi:hypothetical protein
MRQHSFVFAQATSRTSPDWRAAHCSTWPGRPSPTRHLSTPGQSGPGATHGIEAAVREYSLRGVKKDATEKDLGYFLNNAPACDTTSSSSAACS